MVLNPQAMKNAQEEIDRVIGSTRLPSFSDRENLPYVNALILEVLRWHCVTPLGMPHLLTGDSQLNVVVVGQSGFPRVPTRDDVYNGYLIPKGTITFANLW